MNQVCGFNVDNAVYKTGRLIADLLVALGIAWLEGGSALKIIRHAKEELKV